MAIKKEIEIIVDSADAKKAVDELTKSNTDLTASFEDVYGELKPLTARMGELEDRMYELALAGKTNTQEYKDLQNEVSKYKRTIIETDTAVDALATTTGGKMSGALNAAASGFQVYEAGLGLIGVESEAVQESLLKVQSAMALADGIAQIQREGIPAIKSLFSALSSTAIGQKLLTAAQIAGAAAMRVLNVVMAANPILLIVSGVTALVGAFYMLVNSQKEAQITASDLNDELDRQQDIISKTSKDIETYSKLDIAYARERGASEEELTKIKEEAAKKQVKLLYQNFIETQKTYDKIENLRKKGLATVKEVNAASKKEQEAYDKWQDAVKAKMVADAEADADKAEALREKQEKAQEEYRKKAEERRKKKAEDDKLEADRKNKQDLEDAKNEEAFLQSARDRNTAFNEDIKAKEDDVVQAKKKAWSDYLAFTKSNNEKEITNEEEKQARLKQLRDYSVQGVQDTLSLISNLTELFAGKSKKAQERAFKIQKAVNIASAIMDTYKAANQVLATPGLPLPLKILGMASAITAGLVNVKKISDQKFDAGGTPPTDNNPTNLNIPNSNTQSNVIAPNFNIVGAGGANQLGSLAPIQAYVVSSEMTSQQALDRNRMRNATF